MNGEALPEPAEACPHCGAANVRAALFCEECGYDFTTGQTPDAAPPAPSPSPTSGTSPATSPATSPWVVIVEVDREWYELKGSLADTTCPPASTTTVSLPLGQSLVGRTSQSRGIKPEVALDTDTGVSRQHAQFAATETTLAVVDVSSTNGTYVLVDDDVADEDTVPIQPGVVVSLEAGDRIFLGAWTRLTVRNRNA